MKRLVAGAAALLAVAASPAWSHGRGHHHHHHGSRIHFGIVLGAPLLWPRHHYHSYPSTVVIREEPKVYIEKGDGGEAAAPAAGGQWWYYCRGADMYYPYTKHCPGGWERVAPQPQP